MLCLNFLYDFSLPSGLEFLTPQTLAFLKKKWERESWSSDTFAGFVYKEFETELSELRIER
jgi:hypothetical protein